MEELCLKLKQDLENYFSMPFEIQPVFKDGEVHYVCSPYNEDQMYFSVEVYIHNKIRLVIEIYPQKHGGYILNEMAHAPEEKQSTFFSYKQMLVDKGLKSCYSVNKSDLLENNGMSSEVRNFSWEFNLVKDNQVNAFCMPGGKIVVYEGLMNLVSSDDELAVVIGHEVAHAVPSIAMSVWVSSWLHNTERKFWGRLSVESPPPYRKLGI